jgi:hypothetical protein
VSVFETETMAELLVKQGLVAEGVAIYRRLLERAPDEVARARRRRRLAELERQAGPLPAPRVDASTAPALEVRRQNEELVIDWTLPPDTRGPALQLLLVRKTPDGVETEARTLRLESPRGRTTLPVPALHSLRAAAGRLDGDRFIPFIRTAAVL